MPADKSMNHVQVASSTFKKYAILVSLVNACFSINTLAKNQEIRRNIYCISIVAQFK